MERNCSLMHIIPMTFRCSMLAVVSFAAFPSATAHPLPFVGVNAHLAENEFADCAETCDLMRVGDVKTVRFGIMWRIIQPRKDAPLDFSRCDKVMDDVSRNGLEPLPTISVPPEWAHPLGEHGDEMAALAKAFTERYRGRFSTLEFWNEQNHVRDWNGTNTVAYARVLKMVRDAVRSVDPSVRIALGGIGCDHYAYLRAIYAAGYGNAFDVMNIHPYTNPFPPDTFERPWHLANQIDRTRAVMAEFGDEAKPIIVTETGWSTETEGIGNAESTILQTGLRLANPEKCAWRVAYVEPTAAGTLPPPHVAEALMGLLPPGSSVLTTNADTLRPLLAADALDCIVFPVRNESYPVSVYDDVLDFVKRGGVLVEMGGVPLGAPDDPTRDALADRTRLRIGSVSSETDRSVPGQVFAFATERAVKAGFRPDLNGYRATRFIEPKGMREGDRFIPLVVATRDNAPDLVAAAVFDFNSDMKGAVVVSSLITLTRGQQIGGNTEIEQGHYVARALGIAFAERIESIFLYEFRSPEGDTYHNESHFGMVHDNFAPKPAFSACKTFSRACPPGSVPVGDEWHDRNRKVHHVRWKRPDGRDAGMLWTAGEPVDKHVEFKGCVRFLDVWGRRIVLPSPRKGEYIFPLAGAPIYYILQ